MAAGLKESGKPDVAVVVNDGPDATAAGVFTTNRVKAAPVRWSQQVLKAGILRAVVLNSGGANACTGAQGFQDTHRTAEHLAARLTQAQRQPIGAVDVAVCSTGLIGELLPMDKLLAGVDAAVRGLARDGGPAAAEAIMTTDTRPKTTVKTGDGFVVGGMAKGAGMLPPSLATMLCVVTTDAVADAATLDTVLREACRVTFDRVDSDGCLSTNDTVLLLASGASGIQPTVEELQRVVTAACLDLALQLVGDAEGATKDITIDVVNAASDDDAVEVARAIARNNLVKSRVLRQRPQLGPDPRRGRHGVGRVRPGRGRRRGQRRPDLPGRRRRRRPVQSRPVRREVHVVRRPARRRRRRDGLDQRPVDRRTCTRTRRTRRERPTRPRHRARQGEHADRGTAVAGPSSTARRSWSSTAATP